MERAVLFVPAPLMPPTQFLGNSLRSQCLIHVAHPLRRLSTHRVPVTAITPRTPDPNKKKRRGRRKELEQWQKMIDRDLNDDNRGAGFWPVGSSVRNAAEKRARLARIKRRREKIMKQLNLKGVVDTTLIGGALDMLLYTLRARYLERMYAEDVDEEPTELTGDVEALYALAIKEIRRCDALYYADNPAPLVTDREYDELVMHLLELERYFPQLVRADSPSQTVGHAAARDAAALHDAEEAAGGPVRAQEMAWRPAVRHFAQVTHPVRMLSLSNAYAQRDLASFGSKLEHSGSQVSVEMKIDGIALSLHYEARELVLAATRGNGRIGDDVTENVRAALVGRGVPEKLPDTAPAALVIVRGEVFISPQDFAVLQENSETKLSNARNSAAGALKHKDPAEVSARRLQFVAYDCLVKAEDADVEVASDDGGFQSMWPTQGETLTSLPKWGFGEMPKFALFDTVAEVEAFAAEMEFSRSELPFEADGVVLKINDAAKRSALGNTAKAPRGAIALKFTARSVLTTVNSVRMQVSRTGVVTPVAELAPVVLGGATISRATLHNFDEVKRLGVAVGDTVMLERGGDVIPKVTRVEQMGKRRALILPPTECPCCGSELSVKKEEGAATTVTCTEPTNCAGQNLGRLLHFARRDAMDIAGMGTKTASKLLDSGLVVRLADLFTLSLEDISSLEGFRQKSSQALHTAISDAAENRSLERVIIALGVPGIGRASARALALKAGTIEGLRRLTSPSDSTLLNMPNVAEKSADRIAEYLGSVRVQAELTELGKTVRINGIVDEPDSDLDEKSEPKQAVVDGVEVPGKLFAVTGTLNAMPRAEALQRIKKAGGKVSASLTKKTDYLICGVDPGFKYHKAQRLGVKILFEEDLETLLGTISSDGDGEKKDGQEVAVEVPKLMQNPEVERILAEHGDSLSDESLDAAVQSLDDNMEKATSAKTVDGPIVEEMTFEESLKSEFIKFKSEGAKGVAQGMEGVSSKESKSRPTVGPKKFEGGFKTQKQLEKALKEFDSQFEGEASIPTEEELDKELAVMFKDPKVIAHLTELEKMFPVE